MKIIVIGCGFAGLKAARVLAGISTVHHVILIDRNPYTSMIPAIPDLAGGKCDKDIAAEPIRPLLPPSVSFLQDEVVSIDLSGKKVHCRNSVESYDYLLIAAGSKTNFFGFDKNLDKIHVLDSINHALRLQKDFLEYLKGTGDPHVVITGTGYTGLELAFILKYLAQKNERQVKLTMVEFAGRILPFLSDREVGKIKALMDEKDIRLILKSTVTDFDGKNVIINNGEKTFENVFLCWTTGTRVSIDEVKGDFDARKDGRMDINDFLQLPRHPEVYVAGDFAALHREHRKLRKAVGYSVASGRTAAVNIIRSIKKKKQKEFYPTDLGWVLPLHEMGIGRILNRIRITGHLALRLHYLTLVYRSHNPKSFFGFLSMMLRLVK